VGHEKRTQEEDLVGKGACAGRDEGLQLVADQAAKQGGGGKKCAEHERTCRRKSFGGGFMLQPHIEKA